MMREPYTCYVESDDNGLFIKLPDDLLEAVGWQAGDDIVWIDNKDGSVTLRKEEEDE